ncbi:MAG TPA: KR domain-containing protein, partial [Streptosporangiaceae bacterium]|nr:KR domain-containing protein [Streptosporangiaceae bacterium]
AAAAETPAAAGMSVVLGQPVVAGTPKDAVEPKIPALAVQRRSAGGPANGTGSWARCFTEGLRPVSAPPAPGTPPGPWRVHAAASSPTLADVTGLFADEPAAERTLAILGDPADEQSFTAAVAAAKDGIETGELVVVTTSAQFTGFFASVHADHPATGVTIIRVPAEGASADAIHANADAAAGQFRQVVLDSAGQAREPVLAEIPVRSGGDVILGPDDVILISRSTGGAGLALAQVLACCGTGIAIVGRAGEYDDTELVGGLEQLRSAGARIGYEVIDVSDQASLTAAIRRVEDRLGKVTALAYGSATDDPVPVLELTDTRVRVELPEEISALELLASSIRAGQLKLIISVGTVADRYGLAASSVHALCTGALASRAGQLAEASADCRHLHLDLPAWWASGLGDRPELAIELAAADAPALEVNVVSRLLLKLLRTPHLPGSVAVHGRISGLPAAPAQVITHADLGAAGLARGARFLREVDAHYPGIELVCSATLSLASDPYLADYRIDGMPVLPPVLALEALAQAASVLGGQPLRRATNVQFNSPVLIPSGGEALLRVCALRDGNRVVAVLRCADSSFRVDHASAEFSCKPMLPGLPDMPAAAFASASPALQQIVAGSADLVDGAELYGPISFQTGRFRRIALLPEVTARSGRALARGADDHPWYPPDSELAGTEFLLGSPGLNDAALQVLQACVPHRRVRPDSCESVQFSGRSFDGPVEIRAVAEPIRWNGGGETSDGASPGAAAASIGDRDGTGDRSDDRDGNEDRDGSGDGGSGRPVGDSVGSDEPAPAFVPGQAGAPEAERTSVSAQAGLGTSPERGVESQAPRDMMPEELADMDVAESRPQSRRSRKSRKSRRNQGGGSASGAVATFSVLHTWQVPGAVANTPPPQPAAATAAPAGRRRHAPPVPLSLPQLWNIEAVDATGQLVATWRGVHLHDSGPLPRNAAWPPTLLSVFLERSAIDLGLDEGLRVTVNCGQPDELLLDAAAAVPRPSAPADTRPPSRGRHAGPERRAMNTASAPGAGSLRGFALALRAPVPVACAWTPVEPGHRQRELSSPMASAYAQLREQLAEPPKDLSARLEAVSACLAMADLVPEEHGARQLTVVRTTGDGWALLALGRALIACTVVEISGVSAPVAIAILTRRFAHARGTAGGVAAPVSTS